MMDKIQSAIIVFGIALVITLSSMSIHSEFTEIKKELAIIKTIVMMKEKS